MRNPDQTDREPGEETLSDALQRMSAEHSFLKGLEERHLKALLDCAMWTEFEGGQVIFQEGDPANRFYLIQEGTAVLETRDREGRPVVIQKIGPGDVLGWSWLFPPYTWHFDARAGEPVKAIFFYGTRLREACEEDHDLGYAMIKRMARVVLARLQAARGRLAEKLGKGGGIQEGA